MPVPKYDVRGEVVPVPKYPHLKNRGRMKGEKEEENAEIALEKVR